MWIPTPSLQSSLPQLETKPLSALLVPRPLPIVLALLSCQLPQFTHSNSWVAVAPAPNLGNAISKVDVVHRLAISRPTISTFSPHAVQTCNTPYALTPRCTTHPYVRLRPDFCNIFPATTFVIHAHVHRSRWSCCHSRQTLRYPLMLGKFDNAVAEEQVRPFAIRRQGAAASRRPLGLAL